MSDMKATAKWQGTLKGGSGEVSTASGRLDKEPYSFGKRFEGEPGTNPEELIAAAHASCFTMALSKQLEDNGIEPDELNTEAIVSITKDDRGITISKSKLIFTAKLGDNDEDAFRKALSEAKEGCPVSKVLNADIELEINFE